MRWYIWRSLRKEVQVNCSSELVKIMWFKWASAIDVIRLKYLKQSCESEVVPVRYGKESTTNDV